MPDLPTGTITLLFTDIVGSTRLRQRLGDAASGAAREEGRALSFDQAVRYALEEIDVDPGGPCPWPS